MRSTKRPSPDAGDAERVQRAASALSPLEREALVLSAGHGLRIAEVARRLGIDERRAERILARALVRFDRAMRGDRRPWWRFW